MKFLISIIGAMSKHPFILALATSTPPHAFGQEEIAEKMIQVLAYEKHKIQQLKDIYQNSAIQTRYSVFPDFKKDRSEWHFWGQDYPEQVPGMSQRNLAYKTEAPKLAYEASKKAIEKWGRDPSEITHIISVSCTGVVAPGIEFDLMQKLNLKRSVTRLGINFMGCFGAFKGLLVAASFAKEHPQHRILLVCTELCSLHLQAKPDLDNILANSLFSDGASAVILGGEPHGQEKPLWEIHKQYSVGIDHSLDKMSWEASDHGFFMKLSPFVPALLGRHIQPVVNAILGDTIHSQACDWAIHPGGKSIIQAIERAMKLEPPQTEAAWGILKDYGNMSSATFLFVLERLYQQSTFKPWTLGLGFGPGLSIEGILLHRFKG